VLRHELLLDEIRVEFPSFEIRKKTSSRLQRAIGAFLALVTLGAQRVYVTRYHTAMFGKLWVPDSWDRMSDLDRWILLRHERVHLRQRKRMGDVGMAVVYLLPFFPLFLAYGRARIEWEAYRETLRATAEAYGVDAAAALRPHIVRRFVGGEYGWMWPFPRVIERWFEDEMAQIRSRVLPNKG
jgi:hypothetical protein